MIKDEMKNKISMALKDPILQQGFEIICKNLSELEKENAELKDKLNNLASVAEVRLANWQKYEKENKELEEINADLKQSLDWANERESEDVKRITELKTQIEKMKNCKNCKNEKIEGACGHFTRVGICKNWEATE